MSKENDTGSRLRAVFTTAATMIRHENRDLLPDVALMVASLNGDTEIVKILLEEEGADIHARDDMALRWAAGEGHTETVKILLEAGANVHARDDEAVILAARRGHTETVKVLLDAGARVSAGGWAALREAGEAGRKEMAYLLWTYLVRERWPHDQGPKPGF